MLTGDITNNSVQQRGDYLHMSQQDTLQNAVAKAGGNLLTSKSLNGNIPLRNQLQMEVGSMTMSHNNKDINQYRDEEQARKKRAHTSIYAQGSHLPLSSYSSATKQAKSVTPSTRDGPLKIDDSSKKNSRWHRNQLTDVPNRRRPDHQHNSSPICLDLDEDEQEDNGDTFRSKVEHILLDKMTGEDAEGSSQVFSRLATEDTVMINALRGLERHGKTPEVAVEKMVQLNKHTIRM